MAVTEGFLHFEQALLPSGWWSNVRIALRAGNVVSIEPEARPLPGDERHSCVIPGMGNLHSHAFQRGMAGRAEVRSASNDSFWTWREIMYRFVDRIGPDELRAVAALAYMEMLESGFTRVGEFHYLHHDPTGCRYENPAEMTGAIVAAVADTGIGLTHLPVFYAHSGFGGIPPGHGQRRFVHDEQGFADLMEHARRSLSVLPDAVLGVAAHSLRAVMPQQMEWLQTAACDAPFHIHAAEQIKEVEDCVAWSGARPVEWLLDHTSVGATWCLVHATHMTADETERLARTGAVVGLCPMTEANLGDGLFPIELFLEMNGQFGVGSDSNVLISVAEELRLLEYGQRLAKRERNIVGGSASISTGESLYVRAHRGGSQALGVHGGIAVGTSADLVSLLPSHPSLAGRRGPGLLDGHIFATASGAVDCVWRRGEKLVDGGRHRRRDRIVSDYRVALERLTE